VKYKEILLLVNKEETLDNVVYSEYVEFLLKDFNTDIQYNNVVIHYRETKNIVFIYEPIQ
jgi:hypothetical protein